MSVISLSRIGRGLESPNLFLRELNRFYYKQLYTQSYNTGGIDIFEQDWDNLIVLDACRYDLFENTADLEGQLESRISRASSTPEWLRANFKGRKLHDTVYITANPQLFRHREEIDVEFHDVINIWQEDGWDEEHQTVLPETVTKRSIEAADKYPNKRLLIHYIQPHYPFLTSIDQPFEDSQAFLKPDEAGSWHQAVIGKIDPDPEIVWQAYRDTLERALPHVEELVQGITGKSVVTADHGNMVGERATPFPIREWGHPRGIYTDELVKVPWLVIEGESRKITARKPVESTNSVTDKVVQDRLEKLGYT
ncbi:hypothetical protein ACEU6E_05455 [Halorutilales archaeon Cl-col2-1]